MMKNTLILVLTLGFLAASAQKKDEKIEYYTDSKVRNQIMSLQLGYMPYFSSRRLLSNTANPQAPYFFLASAVNGKFGQGFGGDILFKVNPSLEIGAGVYKTSAHYQWDFESIVEDTGGDADTIKIKRWDVYTDYISVPISFGLVTQVADQLWLQVYPAIELNFLQQLTYDYELATRTEVLDKTPDARDFNLAINFGLGAEYRFVEKIGFFARLQFRYYFYPAVEGEVVTEVLYSAGGQTGLRFYF
jgi:hypothetical protein